MRRQIEQLKEFHKTFGLNAPSHFEHEEITLESALLRYKLLREENEEYLDAAQEQDVTELADALTDQLYIVLGSFVEHGLSNFVEALMDEVHRSNMSKLDNNGNVIRREDGKVMKSDNYFKPNIGKVLATEEPDKDPAFELVNFVLMKLQGKSFDTIDQGILDEINANFEIRRK